MQPENPPPIFFAERASAANPALPDRNAYEDDSATSSRKHARDSVANGIYYDAATSAPAPKRSRRGNANINGNSRAAKSGDAMEVDQNGISHQGEAAPKRDAANSPAASAASAPSGGNEMDVDVEMANTTKAEGHHQHGAVEMGVTATENGGIASGGHAHHNDDSAADANGEEDVYDDSSNNNHSNNNVHSVQAPQMVVLPTLINGRSVGVQSDKVADLGPETTVLSVAGKNVTHALWNPRDPTLLATGGDALCRIWALSTSSATLARSTAPAAVIQGISALGETTSPDDSADPIPSSLSPRPVMDMHDALDDSSVTAMAWSPDGELLAIAKHPKSGHGRGNISIRSKSGETVDELPGGQHWVLNLLWNPSGTLLLGIEHSDSNTSNLMVWDISASHLIDPHLFQKPVMDAAWTDDRTLRLCGTDMIATTVVGADRLEVIDERYDGQSPDEWTRVRFDALTQSTAIASENSGALALIDSSGKYYTTKAHQAEITSLMYQPLSSPSALLPAAPRLLATAATDGGIKLWDAREPLRLVHSLDLGQSPALALSFTPDGYLVVAASWNKVVFWNAEAGGLAKATWNGKGSGWRFAADGALESNGNGITTNGDVHMGDEDEPTHSLSWDADGRKLAYSAGEQVRNSLRLQI